MVCLLERDLEFCRAGLLAVLPREPLRMTHELKSRISEVHTSHAECNQQSKNKSSFLHASRVAQQNLEGPHSGGKAWSPVLLIVTVFRECGGNRFIRPILVTF